MKIFRLFFFIFLIQPSFAETFNVNDIKIFGNKNFSAETILEFGKIKNKKLNLDTNILNNIKKNIYATGFFSLVSIEISNKALVINLIENPFVEFVLIEGLDQLDKIKKQIDSKISLKPNSIFSESLLNSDVNTIKEYLSSLGYLNNKVSYIVKKINNNRVNVFFTVEAGNEFLVKNIFFIGDKKFSSSKIFRYITTNEHNWYNIFSSASVPSSDRIKFDISNIKNLYLTEGYYDVQVSNVSLDIIDDKYVNLTFSIDSGQKYNFGKLLINNESANLKSNDIDYLNKLYNKILNHSYDYREIVKLRDDFKFYLKEKDFDFEINYSTRKSDNFSKIDVNFIISDLKTTNIIKNIIISGNDITEESVIRNNILFSEGDSLNKYNLEKSEDLLKSLGIFKTIQINKKEEDDFVFIYINVTENPTGEISSGLGIGSSGSSVSFLLKEKNFLGKAINTDIGVTLSTEQTLGSISIKNPDFNNSGNSLLNYLFITKNSFDDAGYENKIIGLDNAITFKIFKYTNLELGLGFNFDAIDANSNASSIVLQQDGSFYTNKFFYNIFNNKLNSSFEPTDGYTFSFGQVFAPTPSDIPYISNSIGGNFYKKFGENYIGNLRYKLKTINSLNSNSLKLSDRLFLGYEDLRGFAYRSTGPKINSDFVGGNYLYSSTLSSTIPNGLPDTWKAKSNVFIDVANVWGSDLSGVSASNKVRSSVGVGLTWSSPVGPFSISYAEAITKLSSDKTETFNFRLGSQF